jgi:integrase
VTTHGMGGWTKLPNGRYRVHCTMTDGRRVWRRARTEKAAQKALDKLREARAADLDPSSRTLAEWLRSWLRSLRDAKHQRVRPRTLDHYTLIVERHIIPALGNRQLRDLGERHVQSWLDADPASPQTVHHHRAVLRRALNVAVRHRVVQRNVAIAVELVEVQPFAGRPLSLVDARSFLAATASDRLGPLYRLAIDSGARQGELLGLGWDDFDAEAGTITVTSQLMRRGGAWVRVPTKAARDSDTLTLMPETVEALQVHRLKQAAERKPDWQYWGHMFLTSNGQPYHGAEVLKAFKSACRRAGIAERRFHDLRASTARLMKDAGVSEEARMQRLGHATTRMARHYSGPSMEMDREAVEAMRRALAG